ncbi:MAG: DUF2807 domain-containing protein [Bacteroidales bacterium]|nr:DUF2807 domain-containing protein [Bacteroidales bacterium]
MRKIIISILIIAVTTGLFFSCIHVFPKCIRGNNNVITETRIINSFSELISTVSFNVYISLDTLNKITIEAEGNLIPYIETKISGDKLYIEIKENRCIRNNYPIDINISVTEIDAVRLEGSGIIVFNDTININSFSASLTGSGVITAKVISEHIDADIPGSGSIYFYGESIETNFNIPGSGNIKAYELIQDICHATITGSGNMYVFVNDLLDVSIYGSGNVYYRGNPDINSQITGSGKVINDN